MAKNGRPLDRLEEMVTLHIEASQLRHERSRSAGG
jgi:hypothetical protein